MDAPFVRQIANGDSLVATVLAVPASALMVPRAEGETVSWRKSKNVIEMTQVLLLLWRVRSFDRICVLVALSAWAALYQITLMDWRYFLPYDSG